MGIVVEQQVLRCHFRESIGGQSPVVKSQELLDLRQVVFVLSLLLGRADPPMFNQGKL